MPRTKTTEGIKAAAEIAKQIIALSTAAIAFTVTFLEKFEQKIDGVVHLPSGLYWAWIFFGCAIFFALLDLMGLTGTLDALDRENNGWRMTREQCRAAAGSTTHSDWSAWLMFASFLFGVIAMIWVGFSIRAAGP